MSRNPFDPTENNPERMANWGEGRATETSEKLKGKVEDIASRAKDKASQWRTVASETVDQQRENASAGLKRAASTLHENAGSVPGGPKAIHAAHRFADGMETTATYLDQHDLADMGADVIEVCRRYPVQSLISALAFGFLLGRVLRR